MSNSIDERVVQMQFQNSQFEHGVKETLKSLDKLKESLKFDEAAEGLKKLQEAGDSFSLAHIGDSVDNLGDRFSAFGTFAGRIIENLADTVYNKLGKAIESVTVGQIGAGWSKYAEDTQAVQTIMFATGESIEAVEEELRKLTWFTDETSYSYADMVGNISKFTSNNIDLKDARVAMQGIATWAASAGQNAQTASRAMYNISQAMGVGSMKVMDWKSIELANMATSDFKKNAIQAAIALGVLNKNGEYLEQTKKGIKKTQVTIENFRDTLQTGWFNKDVMMTIFGQYGDFAERVQQLVDETGMSTSEAIAELSGTTALFSENAFKAAQEAKTFNEAIEALRDATSTKWLNIFKLIFGNYEEAKKLWTKLANDLYDIFVEPLDTLVERLRDWHKTVDENGHELTGTWFDFMQGVNDFMDGLKGLLITIRDAFANLVPGITITDLRHLALAVKDFGASFKAAFGLPEEVEEIVDNVNGIVSAVGNSEDAVTKATSGSRRNIKILEAEAVKLQHELQKGAKGDEVKKMQEQLLGAGYSLDKFGADGIWGPETQAAWEAFCKDVGLDIDSVFDQAAAQSLADAFNLKKTQEEFEVLNESLQLGSKGEEVKKLQERLIALGFDLDKFGADGIWGPETQKAYEEFCRMYGLDPMESYDQKAHLAMKQALGYESAIEYEEEFRERTKDATDATEKFGNRLDQVKAIFGGVFAVGGIVMKVIEAIGKVMAHVWELAAPLREAFMIAAASIGDALISFNEWLGTSGVIDKWFESVKKYLEPFGEWAKNAADSFLLFFGLKKPIDESSKKVVTFTSLWKSLVEKIKNSSVYKSLVNAFNSIKTALSKVIPTVKNAGSTLKKNLGSGLITVLKLLGNALLLLLAPIGLVIDLFAKFISFVISKIPAGIQKLKDLWAALTFDGDEKLGKAPGILKRVQNFASDIFGFLFGKEATEGQAEKIGIFTRLGRLLNGDLEGFVEGMNEEDAAKALAVVETVKGIYSKISESVDHVFEYISALFTGNFQNKGTLKNSDFQSIVETRKKFKMVGEALHLLFSGEENENPLLSQDLRDKIKNFRQGMSDTVDRVKSAIGHVFEIITSLFTGDLKGKYSLSFDDMKTISLIRKRIKQVGASFKMLFTGNNDEDLVPESVASKIEWLRKKIEEVYGNIKENISKIWPTLKLLFTGDVADSSLSKEEQDKVINFRNGLLDFFASFGEAFKKVWAAIKVLFTGKGGESVLKPETIEKLQKFRDNVVRTFNNVKNAFADLWASLKDNFKNGVTIDSIKNALVILGDKISKFFGKFWDTAKKILKWAGIAFIVYKVVKLISNLGGFFGSLKKTIKGMNKSSESIGNTLLKVAGAIAIIGGTLWLIGSQLDKDQFSRAMIAFASIAGTIVVLMGLAKLLGRGKDKSIQKMGEAVWDLGKGIAIIGTAIWFLGSVVTEDVWKTGLGRVAVIMGILAGFMLVMRILEKIFGGGSLAVEGKIWQLSAVILAMAVAVRLLAGIKDPGKAAQGALALGGVMVALGWFMRLATKNTTTGKVKIKGLLSLSVALLIISRIIKYLGKMKTADVAQGVGAVGIILALIALIANQFGKYGDTIKTSALLTTFLGIAAVIGVLGYVINMLRDVDPGVMLGFSGSLAIALAAFVTACAIVGKTGGTGITDNAMFKGAASIVLSLLMFAATALLLVGGVGWIGEKLGGSNNPTSVFESGKAILETTGAAIKGFVESLDGNLFKVAGYLVASKWIGDSDIINGKSSMLRGARDIVLSLVMFAAASLLLVGGIGALDYIKGFDLKSTFERGKQVLITTAQAIKGFIDTLGLSWPGIALILSASTIIGSVSDIKGNPVNLGWNMIKGSFSIAVAFDLIAAMLEALVGGSGAINKLTKGDWKEDINNGKEILITTAEAIKGFMHTLGLTWPGIAAILGVATIIGSIPELAGGAIVGGFAIGLAFDAVIAMLELLVGVNGAINKITGGGWLSAIEQGGNVLHALGSSIAKFITGGVDELSGSITGFATSIGTLRSEIDGVSEDNNMDDDIAKAIEVAGKISGFFNDLRPYTSITTDDSGIAQYENKASELNRDIASFGRGINILWNGIRGLGKDKNVDGDLNKSIEIAGRLQQWFIDISTKMPDGQGLKTYNERIDSLLGDINQFGISMSSARDGVSGYGLPSMPRDVNAAVDAARSIANFCEQVSGMGIETKATGLDAWLGKEKKTDSVLDTVVALAAAFGTAKESFEKLSGSMMVRGVDSALGAAKKVAEFVDYVNDPEFRGVDLFTADRPLLILKEWLDPNVEGSLAQALKTFDEGLDTFNNIDAIAKVFDGIGALSDYLSGEGIETEFKEKGLDILSYILSGVNEINTDSLSTFVSNFSTSLGDYESDFETIGGNFVVGLSTGMDLQRRVAVETAGYIATDMLNKIKSVFDSHSPSRETMVLGQFFADGLALGVRNNAGEAVTQANEMASSMLSTASGSLATLSQLLAQDIDASPVITPVIDLSSARESIGSISDIFNSTNPQFTVTKTMLNRVNYDANGDLIRKPVELNAESISLMKSDLESISRGLETMSSNDILNEVHGMTEQFADLADAVQNMKIILDTGTLVGATSAAYDREFGNMTVRRERGN